MARIEKAIKAIDIYNEQFDYFFIEKLNKITPEQMALIPDSLQFKIQRYGSRATGEWLSFQEKMWILSVVFKLNVTIMVDDAENSINMRDFGKATKAERAKVNNSELLGDMQIKSAFVIADRDMMNSSLYMNHVCNTKIYSLIKDVIENVNHKKQQKYIKAKKDLEIILSLLTNYEATKTRIATEYKLTIPMWYALLYFSSGEKLGAHFYKKDFKYAYTSSTFSLHKDMKILYDRGLLTRRGGVKYHKYSLSAAGVNLLQRIMDNVVFNF